MATTIPSERQLAEPKFAVNDRIINRRLNRAGRINSVRDLTTESEWHYIVAYDDGTSDPSSSESILIAAAKPLHGVTLSVSVGTEHEQLAKLLRAIEANETQYAVRESLVYQALGVAAQLGYTCGVRYDKDNINGTEWPVVCIMLPTVGEISWHCPAYKGVYDGYSTEFKYQRVATYCKAVGK